MMFVYTQSCFQRCLPDSGQSVYLPVVCARAEGVGQARLTVARRCTLVHVRPMRFARGGLLGEWCCAASASRELAWNQFQLYNQSFMTFQPRSPLAACTGAALLAEEALLTVPAQPPHPARRAVPAARQPAPQEEVPVAVQMQPSCALQL